MSKISLMPELAEVPAIDDEFAVRDISDNGTVATGVTKRVSRKNALGYTEYVALLTQSGANAPTATTIKNDTGATVTWTRSIAGFYVGTFSSAVLTTNKTVQFINEQSNLYHYRTSYGGTSSVVVYTMNLTGTLVDGVLNGTPVVVRIYV